LSLVGWGASAPRPPLGGIMEPAFLVVEILKLAVLYMLYRTIRSYVGPMLDEHDDQIEEVDEILGDPE